MTCSSGPFVSSGVTDGASRSSVTTMWQSVAWIHLAISSATMSGLSCSTVAPVSQVACRATMYSGMFGSSMPTRRPRPGTPRLAQGTDAKRGTFRQDSIRGALRQKAYRLFRSGKRCPHFPCQSDEWNAQDRGSKRARHMDKHRARHDAKGVPPTLRTGRERWAHSSHRTVRLRYSTGKVPLP